MSSKLLFITCALFFFAQIVAGQTKNEKEERIKLSEFPNEAQNVVKALPKDCKRIKFYKETDGNKKSFEAKFKYKKKRYSLEFSEDGTIEDIEVSTKLKSIDKSTQTNIKNYLKKSFVKHKFIKIQKQFIYTSDINTSQFVSDVLSENSKATANFEIIAEVKTDKTRNLREFIFNSEGTFLNARILKPSSYEHVLY